MIKFELYKLFSTDFSQLYEKINYIRPTLYNTFMLKEICKLLLDRKLFYISSADQLLHTKMY